MDQIQPTRNNPYPNLTNFSLRVVAGMFSKPGLIALATLTVGLISGYFIGSHPTPSSPIPTPASISLPATLSTQQGRLTKLTASVSNGSQPVWLIPPDTAINFDVALPKTGESIGVVSLGNSSGSIGAIALINGKVYGPVWTSLNPTTPTPPAPVPPPGPTDPFAATLQSAFSQEDAGTRSQNTAKLSALYLQAADTTVNDPNLKTHGDLMTTERAAIFTLLKDPGPQPTIIPKIRQAIGAELSTKLPTSASAPLDSNARILVQTQWKRIGTLLAGLK